MIFRSYVNVYQRVTPMFTTSIYPPPWPVKQLIDLAKDLGRADLVIPHSFFRGDGGGEPELWEINSQYGFVQSGAPVYGS